MKKISDTEYQDTLALNADQRFDYLVKKLVEGAEVWSLHSAAGWVVQTSGGDECFPIWPSQEFAEAWAIDEWSDCQAKAISLDNWLERWTAGMEKDGTLIAAFPVEDEDCLIVEPGDLYDALIDFLEEAS